MTEEFQPMESNHLSFSTIRNEEINTLRHPATEKKINHGHGTTFFFSTIITVRSGTQNNFAIEKSNHKNRSSLVPFLEPSIISSTIIVDARSTLRHFEEVKLNNKSA